MRPKTLAPQILTLGLALHALTARADDAEFCPERPGQTTPPCVMEPASTMFESGMVSWTRQTDAGIRSDQWVVGDHLLRHGVGRNTELQLGWRMLTRSTGSATQTGDVSVGLLHNFSGIDGPVALQVFATLPTGGEAVGAGDWGAGARLPIALKLNDDWSLGLTPEVGATVNTTGRGRHAAFGGAIGVGRQLAAGLTASLDVSLFQDRDPGGPRTSAVSSLAFAWQAGSDTQLDLGLAAGLNHQSPDQQVYLGFAHRF